MNSAVKLLSFSDCCELPSSLMEDLQIDRLFSEQTLEILRRPCDEGEILRRQALFAALQDPDRAGRLEDCLSLLLHAERERMLWKQAKTPFAKDCRRRMAWRAYVEACESLASLSDLSCELTAEVVRYFSSEEKKCLLAELRESLSQAQACFDRMRVGLLSLSDKCWLTPDRDAVSEWDRIAEQATELGLSLPERRILHTEPDPSLSEALCRLYEAECGEIARLLDRFDAVDYEEPLRYIPALRFFLEIHALTERAGAVGIPHCLPRVAPVPQLTARELYDILLWVRTAQTVVPNDAFFTEREPFYFLVGANGGGKTTYLRAVGINLVLFLAGCPIFAREAEIYPFDFVAAHLPRDERFEGVGRLDEELARTEAMLTQAEGKRAFLLLNETYSGTDECRGFELLRATAGRIVEAGHSGLYVTHFHEVMTLEHPVLSAEIESAQDNRRTWRIVKSKGNAASYAADILKKYHLDPDSLRERRTRDEN